MKRVLRSESGQAGIGRLLAGYLRLLRATTRWRITRPPAAAALLDGGTPFIACFWHGRIATMRAAWSREPKHFHMLISGHRDGLVIARAMRRLGFGTIEGSSRRGGADAFRALRKVLERGDCAGITPDGPRGPRMRAKNGAIKAAQTAGVPVLPVSGAVRRCRYLDSWDRFCLAGLFSYGVILFGEPLTVPPGAGKDELEALRLELEQRLNALTAEADRLCGHPAIEPAPAPSAASVAAAEGAGKVRHAGA